MALMLSFLSIFLSVFGFIYPLLPTFILKIGYGWWHKMETKRALIRMGVVVLFALFILAQPSFKNMIFTTIPFAFFWIMSFFNNPYNVFTELDAHHIVKQTSSKMDISNEIVGLIAPNGHGIAYPINEMVMPRHLLNDNFEGQPILISYCAACRSTIVYSRIVEGQTLTFQVMGVYRRNMVIRDKETGTIWQQGTGKAAFGKLKNKQLTMLSYQQMTLDEWLKIQPKSLIATESDDAPKGFLPKEKLLKMLKITERLIAPGLTNLKGLPLREKIWSVEINGKSKAYPIVALKKMTKLIDRVGDIDIEINYVAASNFIEGKEIKTGNPLRFQNHWWFGWKEFHPNTEIFVNPFVE